MANGMPFRRATSTRGWFGKQSKTIRFGPATSVIDSAIDRINLSTLGLGHESEGSEKMWGAAGNVTRGNFAASSKPWLLPSTAKRRSVEGLSSRRAKAIATKRLT